MEREQSRACNYDRYHKPMRNAASRTARRFRLSAFEAEDLLSDLWVRVLSDPRLLERFRGESNLETYFCAIARNLVLDARIKTRGKWRPTSSAKRHGTVAVELERMLLRDGVPAEVAVERLHATNNTVTRRELQALAGAVVRKPRRDHVACMDLDSRPSTEPSPYEQVLCQEAARHAARATAALSQALTHVSHADRHLLLQRYVHRHTVTRIAQSMSLPVKPLYRRCEGLLQALRRRLENAGVDGGCVRESFRPESRECAASSPAKASMS